MEARQDGRRLVWEGSQIDLGGVLKFGDSTRRPAAGLRWGIPNDRRGLTLSGDSTIRPAAGLGGVPS